MVVGRGDTVLYEKAYGQRAVAPLAEPMTLDTIFDLASLTKVVATTTAVMQLVEQGTVRLTDPVASWVPGFERYGKGGITVRHLLTHVSGLRPDVDLGEPWKGYEAAIDLAVDEVPTVAARRAVRLQRHQLLPARPHRGARVGRAARAATSAGTCSGRSA